MTEHNWRYNTKQRHRVPDLGSRTKNQRSSSRNNSNIAQSAEKHELKFRFSHIERATLPGFNDKEIQENLFKWGMKEHMYLKRFSYDQYLNPLEIDEFILQFFNDPAVNPHIRVIFTC